MARTSQHALVRDDEVVAGLIGRVGAGRAVGTDMHVLVAGGDTDALAEGAVLVLRDDGLVRLGHSID